ncbi:MAG: hypothetical protein ACJ75S_00960, partial [Solirubrobacterales bacterium]
MNRITASALIGAGALLAAVLPATASAADTAPVYHVTQEGVSADQGARLAAAFNIPNALDKTGAFSFAGPSFGQVPLRRVAVGKDEAGRPTVSQAIDTKALAAIRPLPDNDALDRANKLLDIAQVSPELRPIPSVSHTKLTLADKLGRKLSDTPLDTAVSFRFELGGLPVSGQGAKLRATFAGDGSVTQLSDTLRGLQRGADVAVIPADKALAACQKLYGPLVRQGAPTLGYVLPPLGQVKDIYPSYTCNPSAARGTQAHRQIPAVAGVAPKAVIKASRVGQA